MSTTLSTRKTEYLEQVSAGLSDLSDEDREEVLQDLRIHLNEIDDRDVFASLGSPEAFVEEFRRSAGLDGTLATPSPFARLRVRLDSAGSRLAELSNWPTTRPVWIWTRGWLAVSLFAIMSEPIPFRRFPIPVIERSTMWGLVFVAVMTAFSVWLDRQSGLVRDLTSVAFNSLVILGVAVSLFSSGVLAKESPHVHEATPLPEVLTGTEGEPILNIYAYDLEGNPVDVLLYDQAGRPLMNMPFWVYENAELDPKAERIDTPEGYVEFVSDDLGRPIFNLYPLVRFEYDGEPVTPPSLGFPETDAYSPGSDDVVTTTSVPRSG